ARHKILHRLLQE
nr:Chain B, Nuclear receptor coactivator 1 [synthetic construct]